MSETASFVDPVFLARFGLSRMNAIDYFLHPLNPFRTAANTSNEVLAMQGISIVMLLQHGNSGGPLSPQAAEEEYNAALGRLTGEQYELLPPNDPAGYTQPSELFTIRHVLRNSSSNSTIGGGSTLSTKLLGIYYIVQGVVYKSPPIRSIQKTHVARVLGGLSKAQQALSPCARFHPAVGYVWVFEKGSTQSKRITGKRKLENDVEIAADGDDDDGHELEDEDEDDDNAMDPVALVQLSKRQRNRQRKLLLVDRRAPGQQRTPAEEEGIRASEAMDQILVRISKSSRVAATHAAKLTAK